MNKTKQEQTRRYLEQTGGWQKGVHLGGMDEIGKGS